MPQRPTPIQVAWWPREAAETDAPAVRALARALRCPGPLAYGYLAFLASYVARHWPSGVIPADVDPGTLADAAGVGFDLDPAAFVVALDACGALELLPSGERVVPQVAAAHAEVTARCAEISAARSAAANTRWGRHREAKAMQADANGMQNEAKPMQGGSNTHATASLEGEEEREGEDPPIHAGAHAREASGGGVLEPAPRPRPSAGAAHLNRLRGADAPPGLDSDRVEALAQAGAAFGRPSQAPGAFLGLMRGMVGGADGEAFARLLAMPVNRQADQVLGACLRARVKGKASVDFVRGVLVRALLDGEDLAQGAEAPSRHPPPRRQGAGAVRPSRGSRDASLEALDELMGAGAREVEVTRG